ncbi:MAG: RNA polymerase sigma factor region1.1 domain-containing protein, partial [Terriglobia bacterium]
MAFDDKNEEVSKLIHMGKEKGYLLYDEVNDLLPSDVHSAEEIEDVLSMFDSAGIEVLDSPRAKKDDEVKPDEIGEEGDLDLTPGGLDKTNDPVRMYLREMGTVPLLTREGEVVIARRIERGQVSVLKAVSRSPLIVQELMALRKELADGKRNIKEIVVFNEEELTEEKINQRQQDVIATLGEAERLRKRFMALRSKLSGISRSRRPLDYRRYSLAIARHRIMISKLIRSVGFTHTQNKKLIERIHIAVEELRPIEREINRLERRHENSRSGGSKEILKELRQVKARLTELEIHNEVGAAELRRTSQTIVTGEREAD